MADTIIPASAPGVASFQTESFGNAPEPRFGDGNSPTQTVKAAGAMNLPLYQVVSYDGTTIAVATATNAYGILTAPVLLTAGQETAVDVYVGGHWRMDALKFGPAYTTDQLKIDAFRAGAKNPGILVSKAKFNDNQIAV